MLAGSKSLLIETLPPKARNVIEFYLLASNFPRDYHDRPVNPKDRCDDEETASCVGQANNQSPGKGGVRGPSCYR